MFSTSFDNLLHLILGESDPYGSANMGFSLPLSTFIVIHKLLKAFLCISI